MKKRECREWTRINRIKKLLKKLLHFPALLTVMVICRLLLCVYYYILDYVLKAQGHQQNLSKQLKPVPLYPCCIHTLKGNYQWNQLKNNQAILLPKHIMGQLHLGCITLLQAFLCKDREIKQIIPTAITEAQKQNERPNLKLHNKHQTSKFFTSTTILTISPSKNSKYL